jgi:hypothetical protein
VVYLINRLSSTDLLFKRPYKILYGRKINLEHLKCYDPKNKKLHISRDDFFLENEPFYKVIEEKYCD